MSGIAGKTFSILILITIGALLKKKLPTDSHRDALKFVILSTALPATIFVALMSVNFNADTLYLPVFAVLLNSLLFVFIYFSAPIIGIGKNSSSMRSLLMVIPSFAPGLSLFPFLALYIGKQSVAQAALADIGNKIFVLYALYFVAFRFYRKIHKSKWEAFKSVKYLSIQFIKEPINIAIFIAVTILISGKTMVILPTFIRHLIEQISNITQILILLFIGMSLSIARERLFFIISTLSLRAAFGLFFSGLALMVFPVASPAAALLFVLFPQCACSFWPCAHVASIDLLERQSESAKEKTFDPGLVIATLALSFPFSIITILTICTMGDTLINPITLMIIAYGICCLNILLNVHLRAKSRRMLRSTAIALPDRVGVIQKILGVLRLKLETGARRPSQQPDLPNVAEPDSK